MSYIPADLTESFPTAAQLDAANRARSILPRYHLSDKTVLQGTATDAMAVKQAAIAAGYYKDDYASLLSPHTYGQTDLALRRGYSIRVLAVAAAVRAFIERHNSNCTVVVLGTGLDSLYFRLAAEGVRARHWAEYDLVSNVTDRSLAIQRHPALRALLPGDAAEDISVLGVRTPEYTLRACDLTCDAYVERVCEELTPNLPILIVAECVLVYFIPEVIQSVLRRFSAAAGSAETSMVVFEQSGQTDVFTHEMLRRLGERGIYLPGLEAARTVDDHAGRYAAVCPHLRQATLLDSWNSAPEPVRARWAGLDSQDEGDEANFSALASHYVVISASTSEGTAELMHHAVINCVNE